MKFTVSWLLEHLDFSAPVATLVETLNRIGLEVESVKDQAEALAGFRVAKILEARPHPQADRLQICEVAAGTGYGRVQVVCGAPNARTGLHVIFAPPGTYIPGSDITIKSGQIRGAQSDGMLCSLRELGLGEESDGIAELPDTVVLGQAYAVFAGLDETIIDISITPNRGDALSVRGVARDLAAAGVGHLKPLLSEIVESVKPSPIQWQIDHKEACAYVAGRMVRGVTNGPSPTWLQNRLKSVGMRSISALVDVTNFLLMDLGRPLHVFDADRLTGRKLLMTRGQGETFSALDENDYLVSRDDLVIVDGAGVQSLAGVIGGADSGVTQSTKNIFLESALFDPVHIALTGRRMGIQTDARYRFERGVDPAMALSGLERATHMILQLCGGQASEVTSAGAVPDWQRRARLRFAKLQQFGGSEIAPDDAVNILERLGFKVAARDDDAATFQVPSWRRDIATPVRLDQSPMLDAALAERAARAVPAVEGERDLIEEVLRIQGLDQIESQALPQFTGKHDDHITRERAAVGRARRLCSARGYMETVGFSFVSVEEAALFGGSAESLSLLNPIATDLGHMRPTPLINLVKAWQRNAARGRERAAIFEVGPSFSSAGQARVMVGLRAGETARAPGLRARPYSLWDVKEDLYALLDVLGVQTESLNVTRDVPSYFHPGKSGSAQLGPKKTLGVFGELHPHVVHEMGCEGILAAFTLHLEAIPPLKARKRQAPYLSSLQPVQRDFAFLVDQTVEAQALLKAIRASDRKLIAEAQLFDVFEGGHVPAGKKSLGVEVTIQPRDAALKLAEIDAISDNLVRTASEQVGAELRQ